MQNYSLKQVIYTVCLEALVMFFVTVLTSYQNLVSLPVFKAILDDLLSIDSVCKSNKNASFLTFIPIVIF